VNLQDHLTSHHTLEPYPSLDGFYLKRGVRNYPELHEGIGLLLKHVPKETTSLLDATHSAAAFTKLHNSQAKSLVIESSYAHLSCLKENLKKHSATFSAKALWDLPKESFDQIVMIPPTDKGSARVIAEINAAQKAITNKGNIFIVMHKDQGAKRYEKHLKSLFTNTDVVAKQQGWRLVRASSKKEASPNYEDLSFNIEGLDLNAHKGVYAAGKLDPGTAFMLETIRLDFMSKRVLDMGCGYGLLALKASLAGATVTAIDDDLLAVQSCYQNAQKYALDIRCLHSDINAELKAKEQFDLIITNPPFHIGKFVKLELPFAFIAAAHKHLLKGGDLVLVANKALAYEPLLDAFSSWKTLGVNERFKVLQAKK